MERQDSHTDGLAFIPSTETLRFYVSRDSLHVRYQYYWFCGTKASQIVSGTNKMIILYRGSYSTSFSIRYRYGTAVLVSAAETSATSANITETSTELETELPTVVIEPSEGPQTQPPTVVIEPSTEPQTKPPTMEMIVAGTIDEHTSGAASAEEIEEVDEFKRDSLHESLRIE
uniref:CUB domain-containing protein n=1 Tax=Ascaris lumbricoides TaxID=6252 RepID=A0A0M3IFL7_ASCLU